MSAGSAQSEPPAVVWATGDGADGSAIAKRLARRIEADRPDAFLYLGDVYPNGTARDFERNYHTVYGRLADITWPTVGNHEWANRAAGYYPYWRRHGRAKPWYSVSLGGWELISLNSQEPHDPNSRQLRWLRGVLAEQDGTCRLAFWHRPRFSAGTVHGDARDVAPFWQALRGHARLAVNGHEHVLTRFRRRAGLTEYVAGAGGAVRYGLRRDPRLAFGRSDRTGGLRITLRPGEAALQFRDADGAVLDRSRARCRPGMAIQ
jgi:Calcineurin-like phosphoesterase